jgi:hypothetical protein
MSDCLSQQENPRAKELLSLLLPIVKRLLDQKHSPEARILNLPSPNGNNECPSYDKGEANEKLDQKHSPEARILK